MNAVHSTFNEVDELRGRLTAIMVKYPDTDVRLRPAIEVIDALLTKPTPAILQEAIEDLYDLRAYLGDIQNKFPEMQKPFSGALLLIDTLLGPAG